MFLEVNNSIAVPWLDCVSALYLYCGFVPPHLLKQFSLHRFAFFYPEALRVNLSCTSILVFLDFSSLILFNLLSSLWLQSVAILVRQDDFAIINVLKLRGN